MSQYYLKNLITKNFRNLSDDTIYFSSQLNCIFGENGNGKTNLLEAIYLITNKKSFRKNTGFAQYLSVDNTKTEINFFTELNNKNENKIKYNFAIKPDKQEVYVDGIKTNKRLNLISIFINPFDSYQFHNTPTFRRDYIDQLIKDLFPEAKKIYSSYKKSLLFRNSLLNKKPNHLHEQLTIIEKELSYYYLEITRLRNAFITKLNPMLEIIFKNIFEDNHQLALELDKAYQFSDQEHLMSFYKDKREKELIAGRTLYGAHRDNFTFYFNGHNSFEYCSLGQQKMSYFSLIFAYIELFRYNNRGIYPIVLLDDISGELDRKRWVNLIEYLQKKEFQVFITTANENFKNELEKLDHSKGFLVSNGRTTPH